MASLGAARWNAFAGTARCDLRHRALELSRLPGGPNGGAESRGRKYRGDEARVDVQQCAEALEKIFHDADFPPGAYTNLVISSRAANQVIDDDRVQGVSFTGSNDSGAKVAERAGRNVKKTILELGGSDPFIVLDDAEIKLAVDRAVVGKMTNMGQSCVAAKRFIVHEDVSGEFVDHFRAKLFELKMGDPLDEATGVAPLSSPRAAEILEDQVNRSVKGGAKIILGGKRAIRKRFLRVMHSD